MRANLPVREPEILRYWETIDLYRCAQERTKGHERFILHDGPPFCTGKIHLGHAVNKILKDIVVKFRSMQGYDAPFVPGWDTHGLPTEIAAVRAFSQDRYAIKPLELRQRCEKETEKALETQRKQFIRLGVRGDWTRPFSTMQPAYEAAVLETFASLVERGLIYRGNKPVLWCPVCRTALADAEIEYRAREAHAIYAAFPAVSLPEGLFPGEDQARLSAAIWTTAPWTLPATAAIAVHPDIQYALVCDEADEERFTYLVAEDAFPTFANGVKMDGPTIIGRVTGRALAGARFRHPFLDRVVPVVLAERVTADAGSGLLPLAPGYVPEDFAVGMAEGLPSIQPIDEAGIYGTEAGPVAGKSIFAAQADLLERMDRDGTLLGHAMTSQQHPHCWRCHDPVIHRVTPQWFLATEELGARAHEAIDQVAWFPAWGAERMTHMVAQRPDWCISRQRVWGIPIPVFDCAKCGEPLLAAEVIRHVAARVRTDGSDAWYRLPVDDVLPPDTRCAHCGGGRFRKGADIFDVWFDSACSHLAVLEGRTELSSPADLYLEGHDQYRGWFQASLVTQLGIGRSHAPYRAVCTHGFVQDPAGGDAGKSPGKTLDPQEIVKQYGADVLRLWVASTDVRADLAPTKRAIAQAAGLYRRLRNTVRFLLGNLADFSPEQALPVEELQEVDRWALHRLNVLVQTMTEACEQYAFHRAYHALDEFCAHELSACYLDIVKDRLYTAAPHDAARRSTQTVLAILAETLARLLAPVLSFTAEEIWQYLPDAERADSPQLTEWPVVQAAWTDEALAARWARLLAVREVVQTALALARTRGTVAQPAAAQILLFTEGETREGLESIENSPAHLLLVASVELHPLAAAPVEATRGALSDLAVVVRPAPGAQCPRCRRWQALGGVSQYPDICAPCARIVDDLLTAGQLRG